MHSLLPKAFTGYGRNVFCINIKNYNDYESCRQNLNFLAQLNTVFSLTSALRTYLVIQNLILSVKKQQELELSENLTIAPLQCFACSKRPESPRILSDNVILTSI